MMPGFADLANTLFGGKRAEESAGFRDNSTNTLIGTATTNSADGSVMVELSGDVTNPDPVEIDGETYYADADTSVQLPTTQAVQEGDEVLVSVYGGTPLRSPVVTGVVGSGDRIAGMAQDAYDLADSVEGIAQQALDVANATGQHVWSDTDGVHVTEVTQEEWNDPTDPGYQSGPNSLWNSLGTLFRDGLMNLLALLSGQLATETYTLSSTQNQYYLSSPASSVISVKNGTATVGTSYYFTGVAADGRSYVWIRDAYLDGHSGQSIAVEYRQSPSMVFYDGLGNASGNIVASFTASVIELGRNSRDAILKFLGGTGRLRAMDNGANYILRLESDNAVGMVAGNDSGPAATVYADADAADVYIEAADDSGGMAHIGVGFNGSTPALSVAGASETSIVTYNPTIAQVIQALKCRTNTSNAWVNADTFANAARLFFAGATVDNSASAYDGRNANLYVRTNGMFCYIDPAGSSAAVTPWNLYLPSGTTDLTNLGKVYSASSSVAITTAGTGASTLANGPSVTLPAGSYMVVGEWAFNASGSANRTVRCSIHNATANAMVGDQQLLMAGGGYCKVQCTTTIDLTAQSTVRVRGGCSTTTSAATQTIKAIRIG